MKKNMKKMSFFDYLCTHNYGVHMVYRFRVITLSVIIGYTIAIAFGFAPQLISLVAISYAGKVIISAITIAVLFCETIAICQKLGGYKRAIARKFF